MEQTLHSPDTYDYRQYDRVWQRVAPNLEPYPGFGVPAMAELAGGAPAPVQPAQQPVQQPAQSAVIAAEEQLPGAQADPCCMGSAAEEMLEVIEGFIEAELADRRYYLAFARQAPSWARQRLREIAADAGEHAKRLMAVYYLVTGACYQPSISCERLFVNRWCAALRERYHVEACNGMNYVRAAEGTTDPCLTKLLTELSKESYRHADQLLAMLEKAL